MDEPAFRTWLKRQPIAPKTVIDQISRVRRLERAFGDLDELYLKGELPSLITKSLGKSAVLPPALRSAGNPTDTRNTLRQAARNYLKFKRAPASQLLSIPASIEPRQPPKSAPTARKLQPTGFWMFAASPGKWNADDWLESRALDLLYYVNDDDRELIQIGDLGFLKRNVWRYVPAEILAIFEVVETALMREEPDTRFFVNKAAGRKPNWRVKLAVLAHLDPPIAVDSLPNSPGFKYVQSGLQRTTTAVSQSVFRAIVERSGLSALDVMAARGALSSSGLAQIEEEVSGLDPKAKHRVSKCIERGPIGAAVKAARRHRCQICEALGGESRGFLKKTGERYSEAHHVMPVSRLVAGSLGSHNIMVLCANHHRQVHFGHFKELKSDALGWDICLDGQKLRIPRTKLP